MSVREKKLGKPAAIPKTFLSEAINTNLEDGTGQIRSKGRTMCRQLVALSVAAGLSLMTSAALAQCGCGSGQMSYAPVAPSYTTYYMPTYYPPASNVTYATATPQVLEAAREGSGLRTREIEPRPTITFLVTYRYNLTEHTIEIEDTTAGGAKEQVRQLYPHCIILRAVEKQK